MSAHIVSMPFKSLNETLLAYTSIDAYNIFDRNTRH